MLGYLILMLIKKKKIIEVRGVLFSSIFQIKKLKTFSSLLKIKQFLRG